MPVLTEDNHIFSCKTVNASVVDRVEKVIGEAVPDEVKSVGKYFRKYLGNLLTGQRSIVKKMKSKADTTAENAVSQFLNSVGVIYLAWPQSQTKPDGETNRALLNEKEIKILKIEQVGCDDKNKLIEDSKKLIQL